VWHRVAQSLGRAGAALAMLVLAAALAAPANPPSAAPVPTAGPYEQMTGLAHELFAALDRDRAALRRAPERAQSLVDRILAPHFDPDYTARLVLGAHWRTASPAEQQRFSRALYRTLLRTYSEEVVEWTPERLKILPFEGDAAALQALVRTEVTSLGHALVRVNYRLHATADGWKIFDVVVDGVSYAHSYHDDIDAEVKRRGLEAAIVGLEQRSAGAARPAARAAAEK
jgi:phospholipid transport system substrate-binding protein